MFWILTGLAGLVAGWWGNILIHRLPRGESPFRPHYSICPYCRTKLELLETAPILSYFCLGRECLHCHAPIHGRYPAVEGLSALLFLACYWRFGLSWALLPACTLCLILLVLSVVDMEHTLVLDEVLVVGLVVALLMNGLTGALCSWQDMLLGIVAGGGPLLIIALAGKRLARRPVLGGGDVKLMGMVGAFIGWQGALLALCIGSIVGGILGIILLLTRKADKGGEIPFVPMLALGSLLALFFAPAIFDWYDGIVMRLFV